MVGSRPQTAARQLICAHDYSRMERSSWWPDEEDEEAEDTGQDESDLCPKKDAVLKGERSGE